MPETRPDRDGRESIVRRREVDAFVRTLALATSGLGLVVLLVFAAAQGALDEDPTSARYWAKWWPIWLPAAPLGLALAAAVTGRGGASLAWVGLVIVLVAGMVIGRHVALG